MNSAQIGGLSALLSLTFGLFYSVAQLAALFHLIPAPYDLAAMFLPSLLLAPCFVVTIAALYHRSERLSRLPSLVALCFALLYCAFVSLVYFGQLAAILPLQLQHDAIEPQLLFEGTSLMVAIDCLGYGFMSLSALFAAFAHADSKGLHRSLLAHGLLAPVIILAFFFPVLLPGGAVWMITFPWAMIQTYNYFRTLHKTEHRTATTHHLKAATHQREESGAPLSS